MDKETEKMLKKQQKEIDDLKKIVRLLQQHAKQTEARSRRNADKVRILEHELSKIQRTLRSTS